MENARLSPRRARRWSSRPRPPRCSQVINSSPGDLAPVFEAILEKAHSLCGARLRQSCTLRRGAVPRCRRRGAPSALTELMRAGDRLRAPGGSACDRCSAAKRFVHIADMADASSASRSDERELPSSIGGARTLHLPCRCARTTTLLGCFTAVSAGSPAIHRQADRAVAELRGAGGHRDGERAAHHRDARGAGAADRDRRGVAGHQFLARRSRAGVRCDAGKGACALRCGFGMLRPMTASAFDRVALRGVPAAFAEFVREPSARRSAGAIVCGA